MVATGALASRGIHWDVLQRWTARGGGVVSSIDVVLAVVAVRRDCRER
jgi:hypothetical protein